jgi:hypothetical protein
MKKDKLLISRVRDLISLDSTSFKTVRNIMKRFMPKIAAA